MRKRDPLHIDRVVADISSTVVLVAFPRFDYAVLINLRQMHGEGGGVVAMRLDEMERAVLKARKLRALTPDPD